MHSSGRFLGVALLALGSLWAQDNQAKVRAHMQSARAAIARHDLKAANGEYSEILKLDPANAQILAAQGVVLYALGQPVEAIAPLRSALALDPASQQAEVFLALSLADSGDCQQALPILEKRFNDALELKTRRLIGISLLGCSGIRNPDVAIEAARRLQRWFPHDADVLYQVAELYSELSRQAVNDLLKDHPESFRVHELAGEAWEAQSNDVQALAEFRRALEFNARAPHLHYRVGAILLREKTDASTKQALDEFKKELLVNPADVPSEYQIAEILRKQNELDDAAAHFSRAVQLDPAMVQAYLGLAKVKTSQRDRKGAIEQLQRAVSLAPGDPKSHYALMLAYKDSGRTEEAKRELAIVQSLNAKEQQASDDLLRTLLTGPAEHD